VTRQLQILCFLPNLLHIYSIQDILSNTLVVKIHKRHPSFLREEVPVEKNALQGWHVERFEKSTLPVQFWL
jgi:hypothetical protein